MGERNQIVVSEAVKPPPHPFYGDTWERGLDPWHRDAVAGFPNEIQQAFAAGPRKGGWFLLDGYGNEIGFVADGSTYPATPESSADAAEGDSREGD